MAVANATCSAGEYGSRHHLALSFHAAADCSRTDDAPNLWACATVLPGEWAMTNVRHSRRRFRGVALGLVVVAGCSGAQTENYDAPLATATGFLAKISAKRTSDQADVGEGCSLYSLGSSSWPDLANPAVEQVTVGPGEHIEVEHRFFEVHKRRTGSNAIGNRDDSYWCSATETSSERPFSVGNVGTYECLVLASASSSLAVLEAVNEILLGTQDVVGYQVSLTVQKSGTVTYEFDAACLSRRGISAADVSQVPRVAQKITVVGS